ncbi:RNB domain-containing ribonuclease [Candidatus Competibacter phosphatis]|uniref:RNB domain-containing ribonuclease n=1 Tax=Candidatus Competibacter phosphatis TaxID=221280 RepID=A0ABX1TEK2_9GAMM|nr:RNB domain-containing ribonuclease [Candidatus Competibacter phosphatis]NMQ17742.1 RNB domain-containing ribonuclease [Candidatus Competibacter phosphatis]
MNIPQHSLVLYKNGPARVASLGDKLEIELEDGRSLRVRPKDVLPLHPGPLRGLRELDLPPGEVEAACELLEGEQTTLPDLAELVYGAYTPAAAWATWRLLDEGLYFQGTPEAITVRPLAEVARERAVREAKAAEREAWSEFLNRARAGRCAAEDAVFLHEIEEVAWGQREQSRVLQALDCGQNPESAHGLLLRLGYWDGMVNPYPRRIGAPLAVATVDLPELPDEPRLDLTGLAAYAIDDEGNLDPDDALSLDGNRLWVHIADAAALVPPDSPADREARERGATLYLPETIVPMLPAEAVPRLGLGLSEVTPALSFGLTLDADGVVTDVEIAPSRVRVQRLSYEEVELRLDEEPFRTLHELAQRHRTRRRANRAVFIDLPEVKMQVADGQVAIKPLPRSRSRMLVTEAMLMAGEAAARFALEHGLPFPFTTQDVAVGDADREPAGLAAMYALRRSLRPRQYSGQPGPHGGLGLDVYAQVTSPLRRYLDLVAHQQLRAFLRGGDPLEAQAIVERVGAAEVAARGIRRAERLSREHWTVVYLQQHPGWQGEGVLVEKRMPRGVVLIPDLALEARVKVSESVAPDSTLPLRLTGLELPAREAYFKVG